MHMHIYVIDTFQYSCKTISQIWEDFLNICWKMQINKWINKTDIKHAKFCLQLKGIYSMHRKPTPQTTLHFIPFGSHTHWYMSVKCRSSGDHVHSLGIVQFPGCHWTLCRPRTHRWTRCCCPLASGYCRQDWWERDSPGLKSKRNPFK